VTDQIAETTADSAEPEGQRSPERDGSVATDANGTPNLHDPDLYVNRELSWLDFNDRVLQLAEDESIPLLERLKFLSIFVTNLDEFFMIRVAGVHDQVDARIDARGPDGLSPTEVLRGIHDTVREQDRRHARRLTQNVMPELAKQGIRIVTCEDSAAPADTIEKTFREQIFQTCKGAAARKRGGARAVLRQGIDDSDQRDIGQAGQNAGVVAAHDSGADHADAERGLCLDLLTRHRSFGNHLVQPQYLKEASQPHPCAVGSLARRHRCGE